MCERDGTERHIGFRQQRAAADLLRPCRNRVAQRGPGPSQLGIGEVAERLLPAQQHIGAHQVGKLVVREAADRSFGRIETKHEREHRHGHGDDSNQRGPHYRKHGRSRGV